MKVDLIHILKLPLLGMLVQLNRSINMFLFSLIHGMILVKNIMIEKHVKFTRVPGIEFSIRVSAPLWLILIGLMRKII